ncbi:MAG TPA: glycosyltransferase [Flavisolibacter sp.]|nr:glycosyltransferase [Flavisolibacter sp.]
MISDNRYGLFDKTRTSIFITHQLKIRTGWGHACDRILQWINYKHIDRFHECWVPDTDSAPGLAGQLSHPPTMPRIAVKYIGPLSRFNAMPSAPEQKHVLILLSGPEPQRTLFENIMLEQLKNFNGATVLVRGLPGHEQEEIKMDTVKIFNHLDTDALRVMMLSASYIICRSGYSSVMDIATLGLKSILVPTPGQTEQEYLGASLMKKKFALCIQQDHFKLQPAIELARTFPYETGHFMFGSKLYLAVQDLLSKLSLVQ